MRKKVDTVKTLIKRQDEILKMFPIDQQFLINEAMNIEYKLALIEQEYNINDID